MKSLVWRACLFILISSDRTVLCQEASAAGAGNNIGERVAVLFLDQLLGRGQELFIKKTYEKQLEYLQDVNPSQADQFKQLPVERIVKEAAFARDAQAAFQQSTGNSYLDLLAKYGIALAPPKSSAPKVDDNPVKAVAKQVVKRIFQSVSSALTPKSGDVSRNTAASPLYSPNNSPSPAAPKTRRKNLRRTRQRFKNPNLVTSDRREVQHLFTDPDRLRIAGDMGSGRSVVAANLLSKAIPVKPRFTVTNPYPRAAAAPNRTSPTTTILTTISSAQPTATPVPATTTGHSTKLLAQTTAIQLKSPGITLLPPLIQAYSKSLVEVDASAGEVHDVDDSSEPVINLQEMLAEIRIREINKRAAALLARREQHNRFSPSVEQSIAFDASSTALPLLPTTTSTTIAPTATPPKLVFDKKFILEQIRQLSADLEKSVRFTRLCTSQSFFSLQGSCLLRKLASPKSARRRSEVGQKGQTTTDTSRPIINSPTPNQTTPTKDNDNDYNATDNNKSTYSYQPVKPVIIRRNTGTPSRLLTEILQRRRRRLDWLNQWNNRLIRQPTLIKSADAKLQRSQNLIQPSKRSSGSSEDLQQPPAAPVPYRLRDRLFWSRESPLLSTRRQITSPKPRPETRASALVSKYSRPRVSTSGQTKFRIRNRLSKYDQNGGGLFVPLNSNAPTGNLGLTSQKVGGSETEIRWPKNWLSGATFGGTVRNVNQRTDANSAKLGLTSYRSPFLIG